MSPRMLSLDIETDTSPLTPSEVAAGFIARGLDPAITPVTDVAFHDGSTTTVLDNRAGERDLLRGVFSVLRGLSDTLVVTWNGAVFDFPFLASRAQLHRLPTGFTLQHDPQIVPKYDPLPGHDGGCRVGLANGCTHLDVAYLAREDAKRRGISWSLKPYAQACGLDPVEVDRQRMHELSPQERREYVASDAVTTWVLADRGVQIVGGQAGWSSPVAV